MDFIGIVWLIPTVLAIAALINGLGCKKLGKVAGYVTVAAMAFAFVVATAIFFQVMHAAPHHVEGEHASEAHETEHADAHAEGDMATWARMTPAEQHTIKGQYTFVRANPDNPKPWDTDFRNGQGGYVSLWTWFDMPNVFNGEKPFTIDLAFHVDQLTAIFLMFVSFVGLLVFIYATGYMKEEHHGHVELDPGYARFFSYLALFAASMFTLVLGANMVVMFIGWEGVGLCSYLLIGYYFDKPFTDKLSCADAGKKAFIANRIGDFGMLIGMGLLFWGLGTLDFQELAHKVTMSGTLPAGFQYNGTLITAACLLIFLGATGKSAQIPLFVWLPDAMAGPTPVSALIHAATMVTAGVYMLARMNVLFTMAPTALAVVAIIGALTAFVAAVVGMTQRGIKKILAYSTVSQLGYMFLACGVAGFAAGIFHTFTHAFFKACLFLAAGSIIHALHHEEDVYKMGGLRKKMPFTWIAYLLATLAIAGIFPFAGFWSKDEILYQTFIAAQGNPAYWGLYILGVVTAALTAFYMGRSLFLAFHGNTRMTEEKFDHVHESPINITAVLLILGGLSVVVGLLNTPMAPMFHHFLQPVTDRGALNVAASEYGVHTGEYVSGPVVATGLKVAGDASKLNVEYEGPELMLAIASVVIASLGLVVAWFMYGAGSLEKEERIQRGPLRPLYALSWNGWWWDDVYNAVFVRGFMIVYAAVLWFDRNIVDGIVNGIGWLARSLGIEFRRLQNGQVQVYGLVMFIGVCLFVVYFALGLATFLSEDVGAIRQVIRNRNAVTAPAAPAGQSAAPAILNEQTAMTVGAPSGEKRFE